MLGLEIKTDGLVDYNLQVMVQAGHKKIECQPMKIQTAKIIKTTGCLKRWLGGKKWPQ